MSHFEIVNLSPLTKQDNVLLKDLSYGQERHPVPVVAPSQSPISPPRFWYTKENMVLVEEPNGGELWTTVGKAFGPKTGCSGCGKNCIRGNSSGCKCALPSGTFAYSKTGLLQADVIKELDDDLPLEYCKKGSGCYCANLPCEDSTTDEDGVCLGHRPRTFITECNSRCACHSVCGNRVIQHGMTVKVQVR